MMELQTLKHDLDAQGLIKLSGFIDPVRMRNALDLVQQLAVDHKLLLNGKWAVSGQRFGETKQFRKALTKLTKSDDFPNLLDQKIVDLVAALVGDEVEHIFPRQQVLFTLPEAVDWAVPADVWHVDTPRLGNPGCPGLQAFTFLDTVKPCGGGTLVVTGSHRLFNASGFMKSRDLKAALKAVPYFNRLFDKNRAPITGLSDTKETVEGADLEVVELTGEPGDVYLMDLRTLHTLSPNVSNSARLMVTGRLPKASVADDIMVGY